MSTSIAGNVAKSLVRKFQATGSRTLARKLHDENKKLFRDFEQAYAMIRYYRGEKGALSRDNAKEKILFSTNNTKAPTQCCLPKGKRQLMEWKPLEINGPLDALLLLDIHSPYHDEKALMCAVEEGKKKKCSVVLLGGDFVDCFALSRFRKDPREINFKEEVDTSYQVLRWIRSQFPDARIIFQHGNHDERLEMYLIDQGPALLDLEIVTWSSLLHFEELGVEEVRDKRVVRLGKLNCLHGHEYPFMFSPVNRARGLFTKTLTFAICGHGHTHSQHSDKTLEDKVIRTWSLGCLCGLKPKYAPHNKWDQGAATVHVEKNGDFQVDAFTIIDGKRY